MSEEMIPENVMASCQDISERVTASCREMEGMMIGIEEEIAFLKREFTERAREVDENKKALKSLTESSVLCEKRLTKIEEFLDVYDKYTKPSDTEPSDVDGS